MVIAFVIACLWALHAAGTYLPGQAYLRLPALIGTAVAILVWRATSNQLRFHFAHRSGIPVGLACWLIAATLSTVLNRNTDQVLITYVAVFICGAAIYLALAGIALTPQDLEIAIVGLTLGAMFPMIGSLN